MMEKRIIICGCRDYSDNAEFTRFVDECIAEKSEDAKIVILSGHCRGVDAMAEEYARKKGFELRVYPAEWSKYGRAAGPKRNMQMAMDADEVVAFWDGSSKGTKNMIDLAKKQNKRVYIKLI